MKNTSKLTIYHIVTSSLFFFGSFSPIIFYQQWIPYVQDSQKHAENLLVYAMTLLMAISLTAGILQIIPVLPKNLLNKKPKEGR